MILRTENYLEIITYKLNISCSKYKNGVLLKTGINQFLIKKMNGSWFRVIHRWVMVDHKNDDPKKWVIGWVRL